MTGTKTGPGGERLELTSTRYFWQTGKASFSLTDSNGMTIKLEIENSRADAELAAAVAGAVTKELVKAPATVVKP